MTEGTHVETLDLVVVDAELAERLRRGVAPARVAIEDGPEPGGLPRLVVRRLAEESGAGVADERRGVRIG